jgi:hypothetical protein
LVLSTTVAIVAFVEIFRKIELKYFASLTLAVIPFIYIGFSIHPKGPRTYYSGSFIVPAVRILGYKKNYLLIVAGLALHGL